MNYLTSTQDITPSSKITFSPNPNNGQFRIINSSQDDWNKIEFIDQTGKIAKTIMGQSNALGNIELQLQINSGVYYAKIYWNKKVEIKKIIVL
ncbi:MAG: T9SS type A sorting domain-containing protein [Saprospiraceae bacterium]